jgi:cytochrome c551/c552
LNVVDDLNKETNAMNFPKWTAGTKVVLASVSLCFALLVCSSPIALRTNASPGAARAASSEKELSEAEMSHMSPNELATYVFEHHSCGSCHTMGSNGKLGYTERGKQVGKGFIGCVSLLTSMNLIAQVEPANRTPEEKTKAVKFREFGCTTCHQIVPGKLGLTSYGTRLKSFHMACTDVERILSQESKQ